MLYLLRVLGPCLFCLTALTACLSPKGANVEDRRAAIREMRTETLNDLYAFAPNAQHEVERSAGYGVFRTVGVHLFLASTARGYGVVRNKQNGEDTYMQMLSIGFGFGLGVKDFRAIFVFTDPDALERFVNHGWDATAQADLAAKAGDNGGALAGAVDVAPGIKLYQYTEHGLAAQTTVQGTKYWRDDDLTGPSITITPSH